MPFWCSWSSSAPSLPANSSHTRAWHTTPRGPAWWANRPEFSGFKWWVMTKLHVFSSFVCLPTSNKGYIDTHLDHLTYIWLSIKGIPCFIMLPCFVLHGSLAFPFGRSKNARSCFGRSQTPRAAHRWRRRQRGILGFQSLNRVMKHSIPCLMKPSRYLKKSLMKTLMILFEMAMNLCSWYGICHFLQVPASIRS